MNDKPTVEMWCSRQTDFALLESYLEKDTNENYVCPYQDEDSQTKLMAILYSRMINSNLTEVKIDGKGRAYIIQDMVYMVSDKDVLSKCIGRPESDLIQDGKLVVPIVEDYIHEHNALPSGLIAYKRNTIKIARTITE